MEGMHPQGALGQSRKNIPLLICHGNHVTNNDRHCINVKREAFLGQPCNTPTQKTARRGLQDKMHGFRGFAQYKLSQRKKFTEPQAAHDAEILLCPSLCQSCSFHDVCLLLGRASGLPAVVLW